MPSTKTVLDLLLSLVLIKAFLWCSSELQTIIMVIISWGLGLAIVERLSLPVACWRALIIYVVATSWLLAATNNMFFENFFGGFLGLFFARTTDSPGSGFTTWLEVFFHRRQANLQLVWLFFRPMVFTTLRFVGPFGPVILVCRFLLVPGRETDESRFGPEAEFSWPPSFEEPRPALSPSPPKRDTRYMVWGGSGEVIFVCGQDGGFEKVVDGDIEGAIARRRARRRMYG